jgi:hypothetical protein
MHLSPTRHRVVFFLLLLAMADCQSSAPHRDKGAAPASATPPPGMSLAQLQSALFGYADTYIAMTGQAADNLAWRDKSPERREIALRLKLDGAEAVVEIVTGSNPKTALLDLLVMVNLQRRLWDDYWSKQFGDDAYNYTEAIHRLEEDAWEIAGRILPDSHRAELDAFVDEIRKQHIQQVFVTHIRASQISTAMGEATTRLRGPGGLLSFIGLDPLAGISPAVVEMTRARLLAERALYLGQKMPQLLAWRMELTTTRTLAMPESRQVLANIAEGIASAGRLSALAESLPKEVSTEREAALDQIARLVAAEREALLKALDDRQQTAHATLTGLRGTLEAANDLTLSLRGLLEDIHAMNPPPQHAAAAPATPSQPPPRPFDILEYKQTIDSATLTLAELNKAVAQARALLAPDALPAMSQALNPILDDTERRLRRLILFACGGFALALFLGLSGAALLRRAHKPSND